MMELDVNLLLALFEDGEFDGTDLRVIRAVRRDGLTSRSAIAKATGIPRETVRRRLEKIGQVLTRASAKR